MKNHERFQPKNPQQPWLITPSVPSGETHPIDVRDPERTLSEWHESQSRTIHGTDKVAKAIAADSQHDWTVKKRELGIPTPAQKRAMLAEDMKQRIEVLRLHGINIIHAPLTMDRILYLLHHDLSKITWDTDPTSSEEVTIFPSEEAWHIKLSIDAKDGE